MFEHNIDTPTFTSWVQQDLIPKLPKDSVLILDNATFHKNKDMQYYIREAGFILEYLPPYSPDLNPIEDKYLTLD